MDNPHTVASCANHDRILSLEFRTKSLEVANVKQEAKLDTIVIDVKGLSKYMRDIMQKVLIGIVSLLVTALGGLCLAVFSFLMSRV